MSIVTRRRVVGVLAVAAGGYGYTALTEPPVEEVTIPTESTSSSTASDLLVGEEKHDTITSTDNRDARTVTVDEPGAVITRFETHGHGTFSITATGTVNNNTIETVVFGADTGSETSTTLTTLTTLPETEYTFITHGDTGSNWSLDVLQYSEPVGEVLTPPVSFTVSQSLPVVFGPVAFSRDTPHVFDVTYGSDVQGTGLSMYDVSGEVDKTITGTSGAVQTTQYLGGTGFIEITGNTAEPVTVDVSISQVSDAPQKGDVDA